MPFDPRTKLVFALAVFIIVSLFTKIIYIVVFYFLVLVVVFLMKKFHDYLNWLKIILPMAFFFGILTVILENPFSALFATVRFLALFSIFFIFFAVTKIDDLAGVFNKMRLPVYFSFILIAGYNFIPVVIRRMKNIYDAQRSRGIKLENKIHFIKNFHALFTPFLIQSFRLAEELAESIETRTFGLKKVTLMKDYKITIYEWLMIAVSILFFILAMMNKEHF